MLLLWALTSAYTIGHQFSFSLDCKGMHGKMTYRKNPIKQNYSIKLINLPKSNLNTDAGLFFLNKDRHGSYFEEYLEGFYQFFFDNQFDPKNKMADTAYLDFKVNIETLFALTKDQEHRKAGTTPAADQDAFHSAEAHPQIADKIYKAIHEYLEDGGHARLIFSGKSERELYLEGVEGINIRSRIIDESVFEDNNAVKMIIGPKNHSKTNGVWNPLTPVHSVDDLNLSLDYLTRARTIAEKDGNKKKIELLVVGTEGITEQDISNRIDALLKPEEEHEQTLPPQRNTALMGGVGVWAGYHYHTRRFMLTLRSGIDHMWGKFRQVVPHLKNADSSPSLGWGVLFGAGLDCKFKNNKAVGIEGGVRFSQLKLPLMKDPMKTESTWFSAPYAQLNCTLFYEDVLSVGLFSGYMFPREFTVKSTGTSLPFGTSCKIGGLYSGIRLTQYL